MMEVTKTPGRDGPILIGDFSQNKGMGTSSSEVGEIRRYLDKKLKKFMSNMLAFLYRLEGINTIR